MIIRLLLLVFFLSTACQSGLIPCPTIKTAKIKRSNPNKRFGSPLNVNTLSATANETESKEKNSDSRTTNTRERNSRSEGKTIKNISVEEWDCPKPGMRKYMPKSVKDNIRRNMKKIKQEADSASNNSVKP